MATPTLTRMRNRVPSFALLPNAERRRALFSSFLLHIGIVGILPVIDMVMPRESILFYPQHHEFIALPDEPEQKLAHGALPRIMPRSGGQSGGQESSNAGSASGPAAQGSAPPAPQ